MCLAIPGDIVAINTEENTATVDYNGLRRQASLLLCPDAGVGSTVLVHAGFVIQILEQDYAEELKELTREAGLV